MVAVSKSDPRDTRRRLDVSEHRRAFCARLRNRHHRFGGGRRRSSRRWLRAIPLGDRHVAQAARGSSRSRGSRPSAIYRRTCGREWCYGRGTGVDSFLPRRGATLRRLPRVFQARARTNEPGSPSMNKRSSLGWRLSVRRAARTSPRATDTTSVKTHGDHWIRTLRRLGHGPTTTHTVELPAVYLQSRTSESPRVTPALAEVVGLLVLLANVRDDALDSNGREWQSRLAPSAGGTHAIEPLLFHEGRWLTSNGTSWQEVGLAASNASGLLKDLRLAARVAKPTAAIFGIADPNFLLQRYPKGESLLWRDAGAFLMTTELAANALGFGATIVGCSRELNESGRRASCVGAVLLGANG